jgi:NADH-quinone oxidoreductase subunit L
LEKNTAVFAILAFTAVLTSFYMVRLWKITFLGEARSDEAEHAHESGIVMTLPLIILAGLSIFGATGWFGRGSTRSWPVPLPD